MKLQNEPRECLNCNEKIPQENTYDVVKNKQGNVIIVEIYKLAHFYCKTI